MPPLAIVAGVTAAGAIGSAVVSGNAAKSAANTSAAASRDAQAEQARQFDASQAAIREGTANANEAQQQAFDSSTALNAPSLLTGNSALTRLAEIYGLDRFDANGNAVQGAPGSGLDPNASFYQSPDYQFQLSQGIKGVDAGASARRMLDSGATRKAEIKYAGNLASSQFGSYADRLSKLAGIGQDAVTRGMDNNRNFATLYGNAQLGQGTNIANTATAYGNNYANSVRDAANNQANATLAQGANTASVVNGIAGSAANYFGNQNRSPYGSSYVPTQGSGKYESIGLY